MRRESVRIDARSRLRLPRRWFAMSIVLIAASCGGRAVDQRDAPDSGEPVDTATGGSTAELPADCPSWEAGHQNCETCGGEFVMRWGRFPSELEGHLFPGEHSGICPPPELVDFEDFGVEPPTYPREVYLMEWEPSEVECFYYVRDPDADACLR